MKHITVLKDETIKYLDVFKDGIYVDATLGGAGHSIEILKKLDKGFLFAFDQDLTAIKIAKENLKKYSNYQIIDTNFRYIKSELNKRDINEVDGIIMDLGMSSYQIDDESRGFSYMQNNDLDMRMDIRTGITAKEVLNTYSQSDLAKIFFVYGEEHNANKIANQIIKTRPINNAFELVKICDKINFKQKGHSSKKVFQALRLEVNKELESLEQLLKDGFELLKPGGKMVCITFHSLEDRIVKHFFKELTSSKLPKNLPIKDEILPARLLTRKPVYPSVDEIKYNSRSKSAKLRAIIKN